MLLNRFRSERSEKSLQVDLGSLVAGQELSVVVELRFPAGVIGDISSVGICLTDRDRLLDATPATVSWTFADHETNYKQARDRESGVEYRQTTPDVPIGTLRRPDGEVLPHRERGQQRPEDERDHQGAHRKRRP